MKIFTFLIILPVALFYNDNFTSIKIQLYNETLTGLFEFYFDVTKTLLIKCQDNYYKLNYMVDYDIHRQLIIERYWNKINIYNIESLSRPIITKNLDVNLEKQKLLFTYDSKNSLIFYVVNNEIYVLNLENDCLKLEINEGFVNSLTTNSNKLLVIWSECSLNGSINFIKQSNYDGSGVLVLLESFEFCPDYLTTDENVIYYYNNVNKSLNSFSVDFLDNNKFFYENTHGFNIKSIQVIGEFIYLITDCAHIIRMKKTLRNGYEVLSLKKKEKVKSLKLFTLSNDMQNEYYNNTRFSCSSGFCVPVNNYLDNKEFTKSFKKTPMKINDKNIKNSTDSNHKKNLKFFNFNEWNSSNEIKAISKKIDNDILKSTSYKNKDDNHIKLIQVIINVNRNFVSNSSNYVSNEKVRCLNLTFLLTENHINS